MTAVVYDLERGPVAADAVDAVLDPQFGQQLADELYVSNADRLPPAALMAEWAVRCVYTDGVPGWAPPATQIDATDKAFWFVQDALQGVQDEDTVHRFLHAVLQFVTHGGASVAACGPTWKSASPSVRDSAVTCVWRWHQATRTATRTLPSAGTRAASCWPAQGWCWATGDGAPEHYKLHGVTGPDLL